MIFLLENLWPLIINGIDLSDLILIFLSFKIRTLIIGPVEAETILGCEKEKIIMLIKQNLWVVFKNFSITLFEKQILKLP